MSAGDDQTPNSYEIGRMVGELASVNRTLGNIGNRLERIDSRMENVATKSDIEIVRTLAQEAKNEASRANTRLDGASTWKQLAVAVLTALILAGIGAVAISR